MDERAGLYRSLLADRRGLVVLDNAASEAQVIPLLPGSPTCAVLVTSRAPLTGLGGVRLLELDVLQAEQAVELLGRIVGPQRVAAEPAAAAELARRCGYLPLALRVAGARLAARPHWQLAQLVELLADERQRLNQLTHGHLAVRASLTLSYRSALASILGAGIELRSAWAGVGQRGGKRKRRVRPCHQGMGTCRSPKPPSMRTGW